VEGVLGPIPRLVFSFEKSRTNFADSSLLDGWNSNDVNSR
jgi:hypothetical protein